MTLGSFLLPWLFIGCLYVSVGYASCSQGLSTAGGKSIAGVVASGGSLQVAPGQDKCFYTSGTISPSPPPGTIGDLYFSVAPTAFHKYWVVMGTIPGDKIQPDCSGFTDSYVTQCSTSGGVCGGSMNYQDGNLNPIPNGRRPAIKIWCRNTFSNCDFNPSSNLNVCWDVTPPVVSSSSSSTTAPTLPPLFCSNLGSLTALTANELPSGSPGFFTTKTLTFCTAITGPVYLSSNSNSNGNLRVDDVLVYQLDSAPVVGLSYSGKCTASGFLSIPEGSIQQVGSRTNGPSVSLGTINAGQHTLKIGIFDCGGAAANSIINLVGCSVSSTCSAASTTTSPSGGGASSGTVWSGQYQVSSSCDSSCCCVSGTFSLIQSGTQVTGTLSLSGSCQGSTSAALSVTLSSATATTVTGTVLGQQMQIVKNGNTVTLTNLDSPQCSGTATCTSGDCRSGGATSSAGGGNVCFHESTMIEYQGQKHTMQEIQDGKVLPECRIPHIIQSKNGVIIETTCSLPSSLPLHLTGDHLVYTERDGLKAAHTVAVGDVLFANVQQTKLCRVTRVTKSGTEQTYFGLNCLKSEVLANGIKTSTFGHYHAAPAAWMRIVGRVFGIERASRWGNSLAELWHSQH